jgi:hypothetical protein
VSPHSPILNDVVDSLSEFGVLDVGSFNDSVGPPSTPM